MYISRFFNSSSIPLIGFVSGIDNEFLLKLIHWLSIDFEYPENRLEIQLVTIIMEKKWKKLWIIVCLSHRLVNSPFDLKILTRRRWRINQTHCPSVSFFRHFFFFIHHDLFFVVVRCRFYLLFSFHCSLLCSIADCSILFYVLSLSLPLFLSTCFVVFIMNDDWFYWASIIILD